MRFLMRKCPKCGRYTLSDRCPVCGEATIVAHPHRFSPQDKYVRYRILMKYLSERA
ncbi:MAG: RNA-protein complex protein Nop10 [Desulfurococcales archaeon]|nr:RNA-protein complex protein Nop10 [Desulfurococcales archaeon]